MLFEPWQRRVLGGGAIFAFALGVWFGWTAEGFLLSARVGTCFRIGAMLGVLWLALPELGQPRTLGWMGLALLFFVAAVWFKFLIPLLLVLLIVYAVVLPRLAPWWAELWRGSGPQRRTRR